MKNLLLKINDILINSNRYEDKTKKGCKVEKNRQGNTAKVVMKFNGDLMRFEETNETVKESSGWKSLNDDNPFS